MATNRAECRDLSAYTHSALRCGPDRRRAAFTLIDLLVSLAIIGVLISLLLPALSGVREATRRVVCMSNVRQQGLGLSMYSEDNTGQLPGSQFLPKDPHDPSLPQLTNIARRDVINPNENPWDGMGILFNREYLNAPQVFYCPSHHGLYPLATSLPLWSEDAGKIFMNYQYRGQAASGDTSRVSLVSDGLASLSDYSHNVGSNVLRADYSVGWVADVGGNIARALPDDVMVPNAAAKVSDAWQKIDLVRLLGN
jgi:type II secretory pathway pseudopilin PulG